MCFCAEQNEMFTMSPAAAQSSSARQADSRSSAHDAALNIASQRQSGCSQKHIGNVAYGVSKAATDKMTADMATELKPYGVAVVSLYPGLVRTEKVMEAAKVARPDQFESPGVSSDGPWRPSRLIPDVLRHTGRVLVAAGLAKEYGFTDIDGKTPRPLTLTDV